MADSSHISTPDWTNLPEHVMLNIFHPLSFTDRFTIAEVCKAWSEIAESGRLWRKIHVSFVTESDERCLIVAWKYRTIFRDVAIDLDQLEECNRVNACEFLSILTEDSDGSKNDVLERLKISFTGDNPLFYTGAEFVSRLNTLFADSKTLKSVDLGGCYVLLSNETVDVLSDNNRQLEYLNVENKTIISKITAVSMKNLALRCPNLRELVVFYNAINDEVLVALSSCKQLVRLSIMCRRSEKFGMDLDSENWKLLATLLPNLRVCLKFDSTCPVNIINGIFKPEIPVYELYLEIYCHVHEQLNFAVGLYSKTLETLVVNTPSLKEFDESLLYTVCECTRLHTLLIYCRLPQNVVEEILEIRPDIKKRGSYILKSTAEPEDMWVVGREYDHILDDGPYRG